MLIKVTLFAFTYQVWLIVFVKMVFVSILQMEKLKHGKAND